jgi:predicted DCC family thiol-disulfide oxidoreductase YuxK
MINVCQKCTRLNPLVNQSCHYCQASCQLIKSADYGKMILQVVAKKEQKVKTVKDEFNTLYPDLRLLQTERQRVDWSETILARP